MTPLAISATGACTPLGSRAWQTSSAIASAVSSFTRQSIQGQIDHKATISRVKAIDAECTGVDRLIRLAAPALFEALQGAPQAWPLARPMPVFIALPQAFPELGNRIDVRRFALELPRAMDVAPEFLPLYLYEGGSVAGADALDAAYSFMDQHPEVSEVVFGGVDSLIDPAVLNLLYQRRWLKVNGFSDGFIASEGAAFVRLVRKPNAHDYVTVYPPAFGKETQSRVDNDDILDGAALIASATQALHAAYMPADALQSYWCDMDGSPWRGSELTSLGVALANQGGYPAHQYPGSFLGELGAAYVPMLMSLFHEMRQGRHHPIVPTLLSGHSALQSVTGLSTRVASWVLTWNHTRKPFQPTSATREIG